MVIGFCLLLKNWAKTLTKTLKNHKKAIKSNKNSHKLLDHAKQSATDALKTASKREVIKTVKATGNFTGNKITDNITKISRTCLQNNSETVINKAENV